MNNSVLYMFFEHDEGEFLYSLYAVNLPSDPLPSKKSLLSQIDNPSVLLPTLLFERKRQRFPSGMRCVLLGSKLYFVGGEFEDYKSYSSKVFIFDPAASAAVPTNTDFVTEATPMITGKPEPLLLFVAYGKMYALSGARVLLNFSDDYKYFEVFDPDSNTWASLPPPPPFKGEVLGMEHAVVNRKVYIMAGEYHTSYDFALHCFDLDKEVWIPPYKLKCPALPLRYSIAGFVQDTVYGYFNDTIVGFGPVKDTDGEDGYGEFFKRLIRFSPEDPVNFFKGRPVMVDTSSSLMHLGNRRFCFVVTGNPPLPKGAADLLNNPRSRFISLTIFEAFSDTFTNEDGDTCSMAKFLHSANFVADATGDTDVAILQNCMLNL